MKFLFRRLILGLVRGYEDERRVIGIDNDIEHVDEKGKKEFVTRTTNCQVFFCGRRMYQFSDIVFYIL